MIVDINARKPMQTLESLTKLESLSNYRTDCLAYSRFARSARALP